MQSEKGHVKRRARIETKPVLRLRSIDALTVDVTPPPSVGPPSGRVSPPSVRRQCITQAERHGANRDPSDTARRQGRSRNAA